MLFSLSGNKSPAGFKSCGKNFQKKQSRLKQPINVPAQRGSISAWREILIWLHALWWLFFFWKQQLELNEIACKDVKWSSIFENKQRLAYTLIKKKEKEDREKQELMCGT